jgi:pimeloyl-ACP methyl ester carboxylesterase
MEEKIKIPNSIGKNISVVISRPEKETGKLAILCPGFLDTKDYAGMIGLANKLCALGGYTVVRFDPTGTWESEGNISDYSMTQYLKDVRSVKEYMLKNGIYSYILLAGHSRGGRVSLLYAIQDPDISMVVGIMPSATSIPRGADKQRNNDKWKEAGVQISTRDVPDSQAERKSFAVPYSFLEDSLKYNVLDEIQKLHTPLLLVAGELDTLIPPEEIKSVFDKANEPKKFIIIPGVGHDYRHNFSEVEKVNQEIISHLNI